MEKDAPGSASTCSVCGVVAKFSCGRCESVLYCSKEHQREHWKAHKAGCRSLGAIIDEAISRAKKAAPVQRGKGSCWVCCEEGGELIRTGCGCRGHAGVVHEDCLARAAESDDSALDESWWIVCRTCKRPHTGRACLELRRRLWTKRSNPNDLDVLAFVADVLLRHNEFEASIRAHRKILAGTQRLFGPESPKTYGVLSNLAAAFAGTRDLVSALALQERVFEWQARVESRGSEATRNTASNVATTLLQLAVNNAHDARKVRALATRAEAIITENLRYDADPARRAKDQIRLAKTLVFLGAGAKAKEAANEACAALQRTLGPDHIETKRANYVALAARRVACQGAIPPQLQLETKLALSSQPH